jgi:hypothetical protein
VADRVEMYDVELGLREMARQRRKTDELTRAQAQIGDRLAEHLVRHFGPEALETAGLAMVISAASLAYLAKEGATAAVAVNVLGFAGQRIVLDARTADAALFGEEAGR